MKPIHPDAIQLALDTLIDRGVIKTNTNGRGHQWLAKRAGVTDRTVRRWLASETPLTGGNAALVRLVLERYL